MSEHYGITVRLAGGSFERSIERVTAALKDEGFGILTEIDVKATLKKKLDVDHPPYRILGACNPPFAYQALQAEPDIGLLLPCNVIVRQDGDDVVAAFVDPIVMFGVVDKPGMQPLVAEARGKLERAAEALKA